MEANESLKQMLATVSQQTEVKLSELQQQQVTAVQLERDEAQRAVALLTDQLRRQRESEQVTRHSSLWQVASAGNTHLHVFTYAPSWTAGVSGCGGVHDF